MASYQEYRDLLLQRKNDFVLTKKQDYIFYITLNRPKRGNSITGDMYLNISRRIVEANQDPQIKFIVIYGQGNNFCTGNDLSNFQDPEFAQIDANTKAKYASLGLLQYGRTFLQSKKPIFGVVQGRVTGVAFTQLALFEKFYAAQNTLFKAPLVQLAQGPQMCSSYTFPKIFGKKVANEIIIEARELRTADLQKYNFFEKCSTVEEGKKKLREHLAELNELEWNSYQECRRLMQTEDKDVLLRIHQLQCDNLRERWSNPELITYIFKSMQREKSKRAKL